MFPSQVTNDQLSSHYNVTISNSLYATDQKGHRLFLTDLRVQYAREMTNKSKAEAKKLHKKLYKEQLKEYAQELFVELDRALESQNVIMRNSQPGINNQELGFKLYCIAGAGEKHVVSCASENISRELLEEAFADRNFYNKKDAKVNAITIPTRSLDDTIDIIQRVINIHSKV